jgi:hypothetical protein
MEKTDRAAVVEGRFHWSDIAGRRAGAGRAAAPRAHQAEVGAGTRHHGLDRLRHRGLEARELGQERVGAKQEVSRVPQIALA